MRKSLLSLGINACPTALTDKRELVLFIRKLHPISPSTELIRLGPTGDGGYLVPNDLVGIEACFSPGVSTISGFEKDCADLGIRVFLADKSVDGPATPHDRFSFIKKYVGARTSDDFMTMDDWVDSALPKSESDLLLQMDIEGYEYETFLSMSSRLMQRFRIIVIEFHSLDLLWSKPFYQFASCAFEKILQTHTCVHIHPNNYAALLAKRSLDIPHVMEFTFLRNDRVLDWSFATVFPNPLDSDNASNLPPLTLPHCWHRTT